MARFDLLPARGEGTISTDVQRYFLLAWYLIPFDLYYIFCLLFSKICEEGAKCQKCVQNEQECVPLWKIWHPVSVGQPGRGDLTPGDYY